MTCIIATPKYLAADSRESVGGVHYTVPKLFHVAGTTYGLAGDSWMGGQFMAWIESGQDIARRPDWAAVSADDDFDCLELSRAHGLRRWDKHLSCWPLSGNAWVGIGTGADLAIGALEAGASIRKAFEIVFRRSGSCGPPVVMIDLDGKRKVLI